MHFVKKKVAGKTYLSIAETHRVNGVPKTSIVKYVGSAEKLFKILIGLDKEETEYHRRYKFAAPLAIHQITEEIRLIETINRHTKKREQGFSVGEYLHIITVNRALYPRSKRGIRRWYERTILPFILRIPPEKLTSQVFWEHMEYLSEEAIEQIEKELSYRIIELYDLNTECLLYDITNFYTFIQEHEGNELPKRGKSKAKRFDLNQINLALLVTKDGGIPLMHQTYEGNRHDAKKFPEIISKLADRLVMFSKNVDKVTIVFDKGNNSKASMKLLDDTPYYFVGSLKPYDYKHFLEIPLEKFQLVPMENGEEDKKKDDIYAYRTREEALGAERTVVVTYEQKLYNRNLKTFIKSIDKRKKEFEELESKIGRRRYRTKSAIEKKAEKIQAKAPDGLFNVVVGEEEGNITLDYAMNKTVYNEKLKSFGKTILFTNNHEWSTTQIIRFYRGKAKIEDDFKRMKSPIMISLEPVYHWTDQKIRVHVFCCVLALMLLLLLKRKLQRAGIKLSLERMIEELSDVQLSVIKFYDVDKRLCLLNDMNEEQKAMFDVLDLMRYKKLVSTKLH
ncbi:IS1634 family transposase ISArch8 [subsurface metagenome]|nr:IS1634 family transposase [Methanosarcinales archaeon]